MEKIEQTKSEQKEKEPQISYHFFYSPHATAEDFKKLESAFQKADIYVPESYTWFPDVETTLGDIIVARRDGGSRGLGWITRA